MGERSGSRAESLTCRRERFLHQLHPFVASCNPSLELGIFGERQHLFELRPGPISCFDQISSSDEQPRSNLLFGKSFISLFGKFVVIQAAKAGERVHAVQRQMLLKLRQPKKPLQRGLFHLVHIAEAHVIFDE
jgi:hypothetical protein